VKSYLKIYGPPLIKALTALEKIAAQKSLETMIRFSHILVDPSLPFIWSDAGALLLQDVPISTIEKQKLISKAARTIGEYDFFFEWSVKPTFKQIHELIEKVDHALEPLGCKYTIITK
jgi:hypothetical protein